MERIDDMSLGAIIAWAAEATWGDGAVDAIGEARITEFWGTDGFCCRADAACSISGFWFAIAEKFGEADAGDGDGAGDLCGRVGWAAGGVAPAL
jgi:hypothetical protein